MSTTVKTFRIANENDEQTLNEFLQDKIIRHWSAEFGGDPINGVWNICVVSEVRKHETVRNDQSRSERNDRNDRGDRHDRGEQRNANRERGPRPERGQPRQDSRVKGEHENGRQRRDDGPKLEPMIDLPPSDLPLYEAIRKWRNNVARGLDIKPMQLFTNRQAQEIAKQKPSESEKLRSLLPDTPPEVYERYQHELLGLISAGDLQPASVESASGSETPSSSEMAGA